MFKPNSLPVLIGSLPIKDHHEAVELVFKYTPEIPLWVQLPAFQKEGMIPQFLPGFPGITTEKDKTFVNTAGNKIDEDLLNFYEDYMAVTEGEANLDDSRFRLNTDTAAGFFAFKERLQNLSYQPVAVKGQVTGPVTFGLGLTDQNGKAIFYDEQLKDVAVKLLAQKARWQVRQLSSSGCPVIIFLDEPALGGVGSSAFISISRDNVLTCFQEIIEAVHAEGGFAGIHVCANADWSLVLESATDIISFDTYSFFDRLILYPDYLKHFIERDGILAWGIVPTLRDEDLEKETAASLLTLWDSQVKAIETVGIDKSTVLEQSLITPSCGAGSLRLDLTKKALRLTRELSDITRNNIC